MNKHEDGLRRLWVLRKQLLNMNRTYANKNATMAGLLRQLSCMNPFCVSRDEVIA